MGLLKLKYRKAPGYDGRYMIRVTVKNDHTRILRTLELDGPHPDVLSMAIAIPDGLSVAYEIYAMQCAGGTLVGSGFVDVVVVPACVPPSINSVVWFDDKLSFFFTDANPVPVNGYRVRYRIKDSSGPYLIASHNAMTSPAVVTGLFAGQLYEWQVDSDCGNGNYSPAQYGTINT